MVGATRQLTPDGDRPYVGGSTDNSFLNLTFGYNGLSRLTGHRPDGQPELPHMGQWTRSHQGPLRLFTGESAGQISWLLPAALVLGIAGLAWLRHMPRTDPRRAQYLLWGGWLLVGAVVLSAMSGTYHDYYTVALAPAVASLASAGGVEAWRRRGHWPARLVLGGTVAATGVWSWVVLSRTPDFVPPLRWVVLVAGIAAGVLIIAGPATGAARNRLATVAAAVAVLGGPVAYCIQTVSSAQHGGIVNAGPRLPGAGPAAGGSHGQWVSMTPADVKPAMIAILDADAAAFTWVAATEGANQAAAYQLATTHPVMPIGGFIGRDPSPTLERFQSDVAQRRVHYFIEHHRPAGDGPHHQPPFDLPDSEVSRITAWVTHTFVSRVVDGVVFYDLTTRKPG